jgi:hypothetical protein
LGGETPERSESMSEARSHPKPEGEIWHTGFIDRVLYEPSTRCCAPECAAPAEYEVYVHGFAFYTHAKAGILDYQDRSCPFLCRTHMLENEESATGSRRWDAELTYRHTMRGDTGGGFSTYLPISEVFPLLYEAPQVDAAISAPTFTDIDDELIRYLAHHPELLYEVEPRKFEEIIAAIFRNQGFDVDLTPPTRDGGVDIYAARRDDLGAFLYLIECKRYTPPRKVGIEKVQRLNGIVAAAQATKGIIATTSTFTEDAVAFAKPIEYRLTLSDFEGIKKWLDSYGR